MVQRRVQRRAGGARRRGRPRARGSPDVSGRPPDPSRGRPRIPQLRSPAVPPPINDEDRKRLLLELRALIGASLQRLWLPSPRLCVLQLRLAGRTVLALIDAASRFAAVTPERPTSPDSAPRSQATLRNALEGARLSGRTRRGRRAPARNARARSCCCRWPRGCRAAPARRASRTGPAPTARGGRRKW